MPQRKLGGLQTELTPEQRRSVVAELIRVPAVCPTPRLQLVDQLLLLQPLKPSCLRFVLVPSEVFRRRERTVAGVLDRPVVSAILLIVAGGGGGFFYLRSRQGQE